MAVPPRMPKECATLDAKGRYNINHIYIYEAPPSLLSANAGGKTSINTPDAVRQGSDLEWSRSLLRLIFDETLHILNIL